MPTIRQQVLPIVSVLSKVVTLFSATLLAPLLVSIIYQDGAAIHFIQALLGSLAAGGLLWLLTRQYRRELQVRDGFVLVTLLWIMLAAQATIPLLLFYQGNLSFTDAFFETMSGLSTTGATILSGLDTLPAAINFWRHWLNWIGGMGIIVLAVAILPLLGVGGMQLFKAETPGPMKDSKLTPRITETARNLWLVYSGITLACILSLKLAGMNWLDAFCHAFAAMGLGGLSTHDASVGYYNSPRIEGVLMVFMLIAAMNFANHFLAWQNRSLKVYKADSETKAMLLLIGGSIAACAGVLLWHGTYTDPLTAVRHVAFNLISVATDCGFVSLDYGQWPLVVPLWILFLSCITACSGSTGGGIKMIRTLVLVRQAGREMKTLLHPRGIHPMRINNMVIPNPVIFSVLGFIFLYFMSVAGLTFVLLLSGLDFLSAFSAIIACINNAGPGLNAVGPATNYASLSDFQTWVCSFAMLLGRLEIFSVLILFTPAFWRR